MFWTLIVSIFACEHLHLDFHGILSSRPLVHPFVVADLT